ncbi:undecaprenyl-diphosphatase [Proteiniborus ethanoligenes]|uniref:Undecaprenyl-diphosphatase n=1 Tax=Proteiniborus ethanoligenes TaxID=415015 RepID=A0A1H3PUF8_9FIRM|nr:phosphatase PAP2 family protein [Proteiniborus ethanoligenes]SDZ04485.1 undecaprenyl-diphosphatase [Proteiniborus ethanoligenes]
MKHLKRFLIFGDNRIFHVFNTKISCKILDFIMPRITELGGLIFSGIMPLVLIVLNIGKSRPLGFELLASLSFSQVFVQILKRTMSRERPYNILENIKTFDIVLKDYSFPSGHTTASFSMATIFSFYLPQFMFIFIALATLVGISRIYLAVHYPSDVIVGVILGVSSAFVTHSYIVNNMFKASII